MGTDARPAGTKEAGAETKPNCLRGAAEGDPPAPDCLPFRADTLMLVRAGGGAFEKLSIPRDTFAAIPGQTSQKINAAYAFGGAPLQIETVENFLGIDIDHAVILDFEGFADFIDAIGGVEVSLRERVKSKISGGASNGGITLKLDRGKSTLNGQEALALARTRTNLRNPTENDIDRAERQQLILKGIKSRLTSPWRAPINFIRGPWIAWNAPKAMVSDMGGFTLPQLGLSSAIGGDSGTKILKPSGPGPGGSLFVPQENCEKAVRRFLGEPGPREPECSPAA
jgi:LCP family protein required for cell wall assembly